MSRLPFNVLVLPYRLRGDAMEFAVLHRTDADIWQFIAGGGEGSETPEQTARRESAEEGGIRQETGWMALDAVASVPRSAFAGATWPSDVFVIPEHSFAVNVGDLELELSAEHDRLVWEDYDSARARLSWDSNRVALLELRERLRRPAR